MRQNIAYARKIKPTRTNKEKAGHVARNTTSTEPERQNQQKKMGENRALRTIFTGNEFAST